MNGLELKKLRKNKGWTIKKASYKLDVSMRTVINWEKSEKIPSTKVQHIHYVFNKIDNDNSDVLVEPNSHYIIKPLTDEEIAFVRDAFIYNKNQLKKD